MISPPPTAPVQRYARIRRLIPRSLHPPLRGLRRRVERLRLKLPEPFHTVYPYTQVSRDRPENLLRLARTIDAERIPGAVVECGVLDGGTAALMAYGTSALGRPLHLFDAWCGLPPTTEHDGIESLKWVGDVVGSPRRVHAVMRDLRIPPSRLNLHVGWFHETFPYAEIPEIALLHIDCDFYAPTKLCIERWYPSVVVGGFLQFDDYDDFRGCHQAVNELLQQRPELLLQEYGTEGGRAYFIRRAP